MLVHQVADRAAQLREARPVAPLGRGGDRGKPPGQHGRPDRARHDVGQHALDLLPRRRGGLAAQQRREEHRQREFLHVVVDLA
jgi:hypothetical protein